jgi:energy-coupling factor transporter ATP-binding protein EcfA2
MSVGDEIYSIIEKLSAERETFSTDEIRDFLPAGATPMQIPGAVGKARRNGLVVEVGRERSKIPERKGSMVAILRSTAKPVVAPPIAPAGKSSTAAGDGDLYQEIAAFRSALEDEVTVLLLLLASRNWLILAGPSGTGKSSIIQHVSELLSGPLHDVQVKPNWVSSEDTIGYFSETSQQFIPGVVYRAVASAQSDQHVHFLRFDEMNLAAPEYYLAEMLSASETWSEVDGAVVSVPLQLPPLPAGIDVDQIRLPQNLYLTGTVNIDETTRTLSPKLLDRAGVIEIPSVDLFARPTISETPPTAFPLILQLISNRPRTFSDLDVSDATIDELGDTLTGLSAFGSALGGPIALRQRDGILNLIHVAAKNGLDSAYPLTELIDIGLLTMVLPKWHGSTPGALSALAGALQYCVDGSIADRPSGTPETTRGSLPSSKYPRSAEKLLQMTEESAEFGYFSYWR